MKRLLFLFLACGILAASFTSCKRCKKCHSEVDVFGVKSKSAAREYCGEQLEAIEKTPTFVCE